MSVARSPLAPAALIVIVAQGSFPSVPKSTEKTPRRVVRVTRVAVSLSVDAVTRTRSRSLK